MQNDNYKAFYEAFEPFYRALLARLPDQFRQYTGMQDSLDAFFAPLLPLAKTGKRARPYLICLAAGNLSDKTIKVATAFEMLHFFALLHDDIIDGATNRRGVPTAQIAYQNAGIPGEAAAILLGDYVLVLANDLMRQADEHLMPLFIEIQRLLCFGQFYELNHWGKTINRAVVEQIELFKSAQYSFQYPLRIGLILAGKDETILDEFAIPCGLAFQLRDDWLDLTDSSQTGKDVGIDEKNGVANTVQLLLQEKDNDHDKVKDEVTQLLAAYRSKASNSLTNVSISQTQKDELHDLLEFFTTLP